VGVKSRRVNLELVNSFTLPEVPGLTWNFDHKGDDFTWTRQVRARMVGQEESWKTTLTLMVTSKKDGQIEIDSYGGMRVTVGPNMDQLNHALRTVVSYIVNDPTGNMGRVIL
jgi:hypothetical protein